MSTLSLCFVTLWWGFFKIPKSKNSWAHVVWCGWDTIEVSCSTECTHLRPVLWQMWCEEQVMSQLAVDVLGSATQAPVVEVAKNRPKFRFEARTLLTNWRGVPETWSSRALKFQLRGSSWGIKSTCVQTVLESYEDQLDCPTSWWLQLEMDEMVMRVKPGQVHWWVEQTQNRGEH